MVVRVHRYWFSATDGMDVDQVPVGTVVPEEAA
jgi:hypothetical protein